MYNIQLPVSKQVLKHSSFRSNSAPSAGQLLLIILILRPSLADVATFSVISQVALSKLVLFNLFFAPCVSSHTHLSNPEPPAHFHSLITRVIHKWTVDLLRSLPGETVANWTKYARTVSGTLSKIRAE